MSHAPELGRTFAMLFLSSSAQRFILCCCVAIARVPLAQAYVRRIEFSHHGDPPMKSRSPRPGRLGFVLLRPSLERPAERRRGCKRRYVTLSVREFQTREVCNESANLEPIGGYCPDRCGRFTWLAHPSRPTTPVLPGFRKTKGKGGNRSSKNTTATQEMQQAARQHDASSNNTTDSNA